MNVSAEKRIEADIYSCYNTRKQSTLVEEGDEVYVLEWSDGF